MHLGKRRQFSTFRRTLAAAPESESQAPISEEALTEWMRLHLRVVAVPYDDPDSLGRLEEDVLRQLDPPLNLKGMPATPLRTRLSKLRSRSGG
jgi:hypothetical protein